MTLIAYHNNGTPLYGGYVYNPEALDAFCSMLADNGHEPDGKKVAAINFGGIKDNVETILAQFLFKQFPTWQAGSQAIGDCVSWSCSHAIDVLSAVEAFMTNKYGPDPWKVASECMYGLMRVNINGRPDYGGDGANGSDAAKAIMTIGVLFRTAYTVGGTTYNFTNYSGSTAKSYGATGVPSVLVPVANQHKVVTATQVTDFNTAAQFIQNGYPISCASSSNPTCQGTRDSAGFGTGRGYSHAMNYIGVRFGSRPGLLKSNTGWANTVSGPMYPANMPASLQGCSWWEDASVCDRVLKAGDSFAYSQYQGFPPQNLPDWGSNTFL